jgi:hypothetical protein
LGEAIDEEVAQAVEDGDHPQVAGTIEENGEIQADAEDPGKYP